MTMNATFLRKNRDEFEWWVASWSDGLWIKYPGSTWGLVKDFNLDIWDGSEPDILLAMNDELAEYRKAMKDGIRVIYREACGNREIIKKPADLEYAVKCGYPITMVPGYVWTNELFNDNVICRVTRDHPDADPDENKTQHGLVFIESFRDGIFIDENHEKWDTADPIMLTDLLQFQREIK